MLQKKIGMTISNNLICWMWRQRGIVDRANKSDLFQAMGPAREHPANEYWNVYFLGLVKARISCYNGNISRGGMQISVHYPAGIR